tara:strand:- start:1048 stop:1437 length:390 start_codon:yes stop_codon:yes gene_type:complete
MIELPDDNFGRRELEAGEVVFLEGQEIDKSYVVLQGHVDIIIRNPEGTEIVVDQLGPGELFGEIALLQKNRKRTATVIAVDNCTLLEIDRKVFDARLAKADPLLRFVLDHMTRRLVNTTQRYIAKNLAE